MAIRLCQPVSGGRAEKKKEERKQKNESAFQIPEQNDFLGPQTRITRKS
jgi:hypothetical protein